MLSGLREPLGTVKNSLKVRAKQDFLSPPPCHPDAPAEAQRVGRDFFTANYGSSHLLQRPEFSSVPENQCFGKHCPGGRVHGSDVQGRQVRADL